MNFLLFGLLIVMTLWFLALTLYSLPHLRGGRTEDWTDAVPSFNRHSLYRRLPLLDLLEEDGFGVVVRKDGSFAAGFRLPGVDSYYWDAPALNDLSYRKEGLFRKIPIHENLKVSYFYRIRHDVAPALREFYSAKNSGANNFVTFLNQNYRQFLAENNTKGKFRTVDPLFIVQYRFNDPLERGGVFLFLRTLWENLLAQGVGRFPEALAAARPMLHKKAIVQRTLAEHQQKMAEFQTLLQGFQQALTEVYDRAEANVEPLSATDVERILFESLNPGLTVDEVQAFEGDHPTDPFYHTDVFDNRKYVNVGGQLRAVLSLTSWPAVAMPCAFRGITKETGDLDIVFHYQNPPQGKKRRALALREKVEKQKLIQPEGVKTGALTAARAVSEAEEVLDTLDRGELLGELEVQCVVYAPLIAHNLDQLRQAEQALANNVLELESRLRSIQGVTVYREEVATLPYVLNNIPFLARVENTGRALDGLSSWAAKLLPDENIQAQDFRSAKVLLVTERQELYGFDPFSEQRVPNYNMLIAGAPGTGKSVFARQLLARFLYKQPLRIVTITRGDDWDDFFTALSGLTLQIDLDKGQVLNLFDAPSNPPSESFKRTLIGVLLFMTQETDDGLTSVALAQALDELYRKARVVGFQPTMSDFRETLETFHHENAHLEERAQTVAVKLTKFSTGGEYGKLFDTPTHSHFRRAAPYLGFDLEKLGGDPFLESIYAMVLPALIDAQVRAPDAATLIVYDECWSFLRHEALRRVVETNFRTARKHHAGILALTQHYDDFRSEGAFIYDTTATKVILRQEKGLDFLQKSLNLSDALTRRVAELPATPQTFAEYLLVHGAEKIIIRDYATEFDIAAFGSKRHQIEARRAAFARREPVAAIYEIVKKQSQNTERGGLNYHEEEGVDDNHSARHHPLGRMERAAPGDGAVDRA